MCRCVARYSVLGGMTPSVNCLGRHEGTHGRHDGRVAPVGTRQRQEGSDIAPVCMAPPLGTAARLRRATVVEASCTTPKVSGKVRDLERWVSRLAARGVEERAGMPPANRWRKSIKYLSGCNLPRFVLSANSSEGDAQHCQPRKPRPRSSCAVANRREKRELQHSAWRRAGV